VHWKKYSNILRKIGFFKKKIEFLLTKCEHILPFWEKTLILRFFLKMCFQFSQAGNRMESGQHFVFIPFSYFFLGMGKFLPILRKNMGKFCEKYIMFPCFPSAFSAFLAKLNASPPCTVPSLWTPYCDSLCPPPLTVPPLSLGKIRVKKRYFS